MRTVLPLLIATCLAGVAAAQVTPPTSPTEASPQAWSSEPMPPEAAAPEPAAEPGTAAAVPGDAVAAFDLDAMCLDCHRLGQPRVEAPLLEGQQRDYLAHQLQRFKDRHRDSFPMSSVVAGMDATMLAGLADQLAAREWPALRMSVAADAVAAGRDRAATMACDSCHGAGFMGSGDIPRLAGQHPGYLGRQLAAMAAERRYHPPSGTGAPLSRLAAADIEAIAAYLHAAGTTPPP
jgi:cytochrome c553